MPLEVPSCLPCELRGRWEVMRRSLPWPYGSALPKQARFCARTLEWFIPTAHTLRVFAAPVYALSLLSAPLTLDTFATHGQMNVAAADHLLSAERYVEARRVLTRLLKLVATGEQRDREDEFLLRGRLSACCLAMGDLDAAKKHYEQTLQLSHSLYGRQSEQTARTLDNYAQVFRELGANHEALRLHEQAFAIRKQMTSSDQNQLVMSHYHLGAIYQLLGDAYESDQKSLAKVRFHEALSHYNRALELTKSVDHKEPTPEAAIYNDRGLIYLKLGRYDGNQTKEQASSFLEQAEQDLLQALDLRIGQVGLNHSYTATVLANLGAYYNRKEELPRAEEYYIRALEIQERTLGGAHLDTYRTYNNLAFLYLDQTNQVEAIQMGLKAERSLGKIVSSLFQLTTHEERLSFQSSYYPYNLFATLGDEVHTAQSVLRHKGLVLDSVMEHAAGLELDISLQKLQERIPARSLLLEFIQYHHTLSPHQKELRYGVVVLKSSGLPKWIPLGTAQLLDQDIKRYRNAMYTAGDSPELDAILRSLYTMVWEPIRAYVPLFTREIIISPDADLNFVSFASLLSGRGSRSRFLGEKYAFAYVSTARDLLQNIETPSRMSLTILANPDFSVTNNVRYVASRPLESLGAIGLKKLRFRALEGSFSEGNKVGKVGRDYAWATEIFMGTNATETALRALKSPAILHLATHGYFLRSTRTEGAQSYRMLMQQNGLVLASVNSTLESWAKERYPDPERDGVITAEEVAALDLRDTWLVTLSACDTGLGNAKRGEGVMGLRRSLKQAGTKYIFMTLWRILDKFTQRIMLGFYEELALGQGPVEALHDVQSFWLRELREAGQIGIAAKSVGPFVLAMNGLAPHASRSSSVLGFPSAIVVLTSLVVIGLSRRLRRVRK